MASFIDDIRNRFKRGDMGTQLIYWNVGVALILWAGYLFWPLFTGDTSELAKQDYRNFVYDWLALKTNAPLFYAFKPYTFVTHMFVHDLASPRHLIFNMITLYFLGRLFLNYFNGKQMLGLYFTGGFIGAGLMILATLLSPLFKGAHPAYGASAAIMAISIAVCVYQPHAKVRLFGLIPVKLMWVGIFFVFTDFYYFYDSNTGGHIAHLGGALAGLWFGLSIKKGKDITRPVNKVISFLVDTFKRKPKMKVAYSSNEYKQMSDEDYNYNQKITQDQIDAILDKISASGYDSLSKREKDILFKHSNKN